MRILMHMVTKNIYVSDADLPLFEQAADLAGGMSAAVAAGLRLYVTQHERTRKKSEMHDIEIDVQDGPVVSTKRFVGRLLVRFQEQHGTRLRTYRVYLTAREQFAVQVRDDPDWGALSAGDEGDPDGSDRAQIWRGQWWQTAERSLIVYPDLEALSSAQPHALVDATRRALSTPAVEDLDI